MKTITNILALAFLILAASSQCLAFGDIGLVSKKEAKEMGPGESGSGLGGNRCIHFYTRFKYTCIVVYM